jgi:transcriptional regulator with XRE-family HTH domain
MAKSFADWMQEQSPEFRERVEARTREMAAAIRLAELRKQQNLTQKQMAERIHTSQANISKLESRADVHLSTLRQYVHALGGKLDVQVVMPDGSRLTIAEG